MDLVPENYNGAVIVNVVANREPLNAEIDYGVGLHNWLLQTDLRYLLFDLQEEKEIDTAFLEGTMQLMRRTQVPVLFCGVLGTPKQILDSFNYSSRFPLFHNPDEAISFIKTRKPALLSMDLAKISFGQPIDMVRSRLGVKSEDGEEGAGDDDDVADDDVDDADDDE